MRNLLSKIAALRASVLFFAALLAAVGFSACSPKKTGNDTQWATMGSASPAQGKGPNYSYDGTLIGTVKEIEFSMLG